MSRLPCHRVRAAEDDALVSISEPDWHNSRIAAADPAATVRQLRKEQAGDIIVLPSASIIRNLLEAGELDRLSITLCPELVGGDRLFDGARPARPGP